MRLCAALRAARDSERFALTRKTPMRRLRGAGVPHTRAAIEYQERLLLKTSSQNGAMNKIIGFFKMRKGL